jgi:hypothetical protein
MTLNFGAVVYFDQELAADPTPLETLLHGLSDMPDLRVWTARSKSSTKPGPLAIDRLIANLRAGGIVTVASKRRIERCV